MPNKFISHASLRVIYRTDTHTAITIPTLPLYRGVQVTKSHVYKWVWQTCPEYKWQNPRTAFSLYRFPAAVSIVRIVFICV